MIVLYRTHEQCHDCDADPEELTRELYQAAEMKDMLTEEHLQQSQNA